MRKGNLRFMCAGANAGRLPEVEVEGLLISTGFDVKNEWFIQKTKEMINRGKPKHLMLDSGGYQIHCAEKKGIPMSFDPDMPLKVTGKALNIAPQHVLEQAVEINADHVVALDFPIKKTNDPYEQEQEFRDKLKYNVPWAIETARLRKKLCPEATLFIPVQAYTLKQFDEFYERIKGIDFDGFSLPKRNMQMKDVAMFLMRMHELGIRKVHILGSSSLPIISVCAFMSQRFFDWISFDSTTWRMKAQNGEFIHPYDHKCLKLHKVGSYDPRFRCYCSSCKGRSLNQIAHLNKKEKRKVLVTHNYLAIQDVCMEFGEAMFDTHYLEDRLKGCKRTDIKMILQGMTEIEKMCSVRERRTSRPAYTRPRHSFNHSHTHMDIRSTQKPVLRE